MGPKKNQKMSLGTFLQDDNYGSWADEMEDMPLPATDSQKSYGFAAPRRDYGASTGTGGASFGGRDLSGYSQREQLPLPDKPPYTAHLANLSFDVRQEDVEDFFRECQVTSVRIVEDKMDRKPKGFGYVEFGTLEGLKTAIALSGSNLAGRNVRISVADPPKDRPEQSRDFSDWSRRGPLPELPGQNQRRVSDRNFGQRNFDNMSDAGSERGGRRPFGAEGDGKTRDFSTWERKGPLSPAALPDRSLGGAGRQDSKDGAFRRNSPSWGEGRAEGRSNEGSRPPPVRREFSERPPPVAREPTAADMDNQWRSKMRPDAPPPKSPEPEVSVPSSPAPVTAAGGRPRLQLQKRTVSEADPTASSPSAAADAKASPFGAARPVDTAAKEREVEEKRVQALQQKKEADEKAKAEKAEKAEEKRLTREKGDGEKSAKANEKDESNENDENENENENEDKDENETETNQEEQSTQPKFEVLRRQASGNNEATGDEEAEEEDEEVDEAPGPEHDTAVKPKEVVRNIPTANKTNPNGSSWRKATGEKKAAAAAATSETASMEEDGWSTVSKPKKQSNNNRRNQPARAIAS